VGPKRYPGFAWRMSATPGQVRWPSPTLGQHNSQIYSQLLGLSKNEIEELEREGVIGTRPTGSRII
jgi:crotonobetainyl-CoA:carnitine CoA-transferase CaiB-like acyl-CoA transferase